MPLDPDLLEAVRDLDEPDLRRLLMLARARLERYGVPIAGTEPKVRFRQQRVRCGKDNCTRCPHGPYWYAYFRDDGKLCKVYVGKDPDNAAAKVRRATR